MGVLRLQLPTDPRWVNIVEKNIEETKKDFQKKWNLKPTPYGELVDELNKPVFKVSTLDALRKALEYLS